MCIFKNKKEPISFNFIQFRKKPIQEFYDLLEDVCKYDQKRDIQVRDVLIDELMHRLEFLKGKEFINNEFNSINK
tara:strand:+ start:3001 stop:3225 length:225 start_codon:yes stop_codon:yes gene_type:complete